jgi:ADP-heptose:LPS heptosyltransferase
MKRYQGEELPPSPRIAVIANDALGNFVAATPLLQMLRFKWEDSFIAYFGGTRTEELQDRSDLFDQSGILHGRAFREACHYALSQAPFDLVINLEQQPVARAFAAALCEDESFVVGPCFNVDGRGELPYADDAVGDLARDKDWLAPDTPAKYTFLQSGFIGEIFCRLCYLDGPIPTYRVPTEDPGRDIPDVLVATAASLSDKLWPIDDWIEVVRPLTDRGVSVGLLGAKPSEQSKHWQGATDEEELLQVGVQDLRGAFTLPQVAGAIERARAVLTIDNGILHIASAVGTKTVGLFRHGIHRLWAPPFANLTILTPGEGRMVAEIGVDSVRGALDAVL